MTERVDPDPTNRIARERALLAARAIDAEPTARVQFSSSGRLAVIGTHERIVAALHDTTPLSVTAIVTDATDLEPRPNTDPSRYVELACAGRTITITGHLGAFTITLDAEHAGPSDQFDLVLDCRETPAFSAEILPVGYAAPGNDDPATHAALDALTELVGVFDKPRFFQYDASICAHQRSGIAGCSRCLDACPSDAIISLGERIEVDPHLCMGGGSCASVCPSGAILYSYPRPADTIDRLRRLLSTYHREGGRTPILYFFDASARAALDASRVTLADHWIGFEVEEIGSIGPEIGLTTLAYGAGAVLWLTSANVPPRVRRALDEQCHIAQVLLGALGIDESRLRVVSIDDLEALRDAAPEPIAAGAQYAGSNDKRAMWLAAIDHWIAQIGGLDAPIALPDSAPFGTVRVDRDRCTLCMGCASVCPAGALEAGGDSPRLSFIEGNCVQCGLCERACPESAIEREQRLLPDRQQRNERRVLNEAQPFCCIRCGKPFATHRVIDKIQASLASHPMFTDPKALERLKMCGDCRVKDRFEEEALRH